MYLKIKSESYISESRIFLLYNTNRCMRHTSIAMLVIISFEYYFLFCYVSSNMMCPYTPQMVKLIVKPYM